MNKDSQNQGKKCAFCIENQPNAKNSHYLTDGVIRSALNYNGGESNKYREKGLSFSLDSSNPFIDFKIQNKTPVDKVEDKLGRSLTESEREKGMKNEFTEDYIFCIDCEKKRFGKIETAFTTKYLPFFRKGNFKNLGEHLIADSNIPSLFFLLQVWRSYVCEEIHLERNTGEQLRELLFEYTETGNINECKLKKFPFIVIYLNTEKNQNIDNTIENEEEISSSTENFVGYTSNKQPIEIFMNDFIILFYESEEKIVYPQFYDIFTNDDFESFINKQVFGCKFKILSNEQRRNLIKWIAEVEVNRKITMYKVLFYNEWKSNSALSFEELFFNIWFDKFINDENCGSPEKYSEKSIISSMRNIIHEIIIRLSI